MTVEQVLEILRNELRLTCDREGSDDCECVWRVKPGNLEHVAKLIAAADGEKAIPMTERTYGNCPECNYSATPNERLGRERKHHWPHWLECVRCGYQTETKRTWPEAIAAWNKTAAPHGESENREGK